MKSTNESIHFQGISLTVKREDRLHPEISGNKYRKQTYNLREAKHQQKTAILTFGGAYSNHIVATAAAGKKYGFTTIGVIRGEELKDKIVENPTLRYAHSCECSLNLSLEQYIEKKTMQLL